MLVIVSMVLFPYIVYELPMGPNSTAGATIAETATTLAATTAANTIGGMATNTTAGAMTTEAATTLAATTAVVSFHAGNHLHGVLLVHRL